LVQAGHNNPFSRPDQALANGYDGGVKKLHLIDGHHIDSIVYHLENLFRALDGIAVYVQAVVGSHLLLPITPVQCWFEH
jgi:hypothetical protein